MLKLPRIVKEWAVGDFQTSHYHILCLAIEGQIVIRRLVKAPQQFLIPVPSSICLDEGIQRDEGVTIFGVLVWKHSSLLRTLFGDGLSFGVSWTGVTRLWSCIIRLRAIVLLARSLLSFIQEIWIPWRLYHRRRHPSRNLLAKIVFLTIEQDLRLVDPWISLLLIQRRQQTNTSLIWRRSPQAILWAFLCKHVLKGLLSEFSIFAYYLFHEVYLLLPYYLLLEAKTTSRFVRTNYSYWSLFCQILFGVLIVWIFSVQHLLRGVPADSVE